MTVLQQGPPCPCLLISDVWPFRYTGSLHGAPASRGGGGAWYGVVQWGKPWYRPPPCWLGEPQSSHGVRTARTPPPHARRSGEPRGRGAWCPGLRTSSPVITRRRNQTQHATIRKATSCGAANREFKRFPVNSLCDTESQDLACFHHGQCSDVQATSSNSLMIALDAKQSKSNLSGRDWQPPKSGSSFLTSVRIAMKVDSRAQLGAFQASVLAFRARSLQNVN